MASENQPDTKNKKPLKDILIIEDDPQLLKFYTHCIEEMKLFRNVIIARDGAEGFRKMVNQSFELVIVDLVMPKLDGERLIHYVLSDQFQTTHGKSRKIPIMVVVSGYIDYDTQERLTELGVRYFIEKPFSRKMFEQKFREIVQVEQIVSIP